MCQQPVIDTDGGILRLHRRRGSVRAQKLLQLRRISDSTAVDDKRLRFRDNDTAEHLRRCGISQKIEYGHDVSPLHGIKRCCNATCSTPDVLKNRRRAEYQPP